MKFENQYLTHKEYIELNGVQMDEVPFNLLELEARKKIDERTYGRLKNLKNQVIEVKVCMKQLIDEIHSTNQDSKKKNISSETVGSYSVSYSKIESTEQIRKYSQIIDYWLGECKLDDGTPYLYRG